MVRKSAQPIRKLLGLPPFGRHHSTALRHPIFWTNTLNDFGGDLYKINPKRDLISTPDLPQIFRNCIILNQSKLFQGENFLYDLRSPSGMPLVLSPRIDILRQLQSLEGNKKAFASGKKEE